VARPKTILITGAAGSIGRSLRDHLTNRYRLRLMYHTTVLPARDGNDVVVADITQLDQVQPSMDGIDAVVHMAGNPRMRATHEEVLQANMLGTYVVYEAARRAKVPRVVFASTNHVTGQYERDGLPVDPSMPVRPDSYYGASKAYGEALGRYYADALGVSVICLRIGSFLEQPTTERNLSTWMSPRDMAQLTWRAIETDVPFGIYYGISGNTRRQWSIDNAIADLGYAPDDDAERFAEQILDAGNER